MLKIRNPNYKCQMKIRNLKFPISQYLTFNHSNLEISFEIRDSDFVISVVICRTIIFSAIVIK